MKMDEFWMKFKVWLVKNRFFLLHRRIIGIEYFANYNKKKKKTANNRLFLCTLHVLITCFPQICFVILWTLYIMISFLRYFLKSYTRRYILISVPVCKNLT